jgi:hypothetical protein
MVGFDRHHFKQRSSLVAAEKDEPIGLGRRAAGRRLTQDARRRADNVRAPLATDSVFGRRSRPSNLHR